MQQVYNENPVSMSSVFQPIVRVKMVLGVFLLLILSLIFWQWISSPLVVAVSGVGQISVPATSATLTVTTAVNAASVQDVIVSINNKANNIKQTLMNNGIADSDISISQITTYPASLLSVSATGYQSSVQISAKTTNVPAVSGLVADLYSAGATVVSQPVLNVENQKDLEAQATAEALVDAKSQISDIAKRNMKFLKKMVVLDEQTTSSTSTTSSKADEKTLAQNELAAANGVFKIAKVVTVQYKLW